MNRKNLYIFDTGRGNAGYRLGKQIHMRMNTDGLYKSKPHFFSYFIIFSIELQFEYLKNTVLP